MIRSYALHKITDEAIDCFSPIEYSRFKFGDDFIARKFGISLSAYFIENYLVHSVSRQQMVVISSPYAHIPTATFAMKDAFAEATNRWLAERGIPLLEETKVSRTITYKEDYGALDAAERIKLIGNDVFHIDREFIKNKVLLFLDDIKITGSHERMILKMIGEYGLDNEIHMIYFAELVNKQIHPNIENYLNYYYVKSVFDLDNIVKSGNFKFNTRVIKYILNYEFAGFSSFLQRQTADFVEELYNLAIGNGYHTIEAYAANLNYIKNHILTNKLKEVSHGN